MLELLAAAIFGRIAQLGESSDFVLAFSGRAREPQHRPTWGAATEGSLGCSGSACGAAGAWADPVCAGAASADEEREKTGPPTHSTGTAAS